MVNLIFNERLEYDANGNITGQLRKNEAGVAINNLTYNRLNSNGKILQNRLYHVNDAVALNAFNDDIDDQGTFVNGGNINAANNYGYTEIGELNRNDQKEIAEIKYTATGKVKEVIRIANSSKKNLKFDYDAMGNRVAKHTYNSSNQWEKSTYYVRDAQGNVLSVYEHIIDNQSQNASFAQTEKHIFGSQRGGIEKTFAEMIGAPAVSTTQSSRTLRNKQYELSNHLGNVLVVVSDCKLPLDTDNDTIVDGYSADIVSAQDYSPFGVILDNRNWSSSDYRYSFNGKEQDNEVSGTGNTINYDARILDTRLGRFLSVDPLTAKFPMLTPYQLSSNNPILNVDLDGLEGVSYRVVKKDETTGEVTAIKRVVEVDIHLAVNEKGRKGAYSTKSAEQLKTLMTTKYNEKGYLDDEGLTVEFKFNFKEFDPKTTKPTDLARSLKSNRTPTNYSVNTWDTEGNAIVKPYESFTDVVMWKQNISANGQQSLNTIKINPDRGIYGFGHAESHELTHFLLMSTGHTIQTPNAIDDHSLGGWMQYGTRHTDGYGNTTKIEGVDFNFSQDAFKQILQSVPRVDDKVQE
ncbi:MAG: RHS repeat domain-containing protein [Bacteroidia bacterium]